VGADFLDLHLHATLTVVSTPLGRMPGIAIPDLLVYFTANLGPMLHHLAGLPRYRAAARGMHPMLAAQLAEPQGTIVGVETGAVTTARQLEPEEVVRLVTRFRATGLAERPLEFRTKDHVTADLAMDVSFTGAVGPRAFRLSYGGLYPFGLVAAPGRDEWRELACELVAAAQAQMDCATFARPANGT
jgi:hypothetical protein